MHFMGMNMAKKDRENAQSDTPQEFVAIGEVMGAWGLKGAFRVKPLTDFPERFEPGEAVFLGGVRHTIESSMWQKGVVVVRLGGIETPEDAAGLRRKTLEIPRGALHELPEGQYYQFEIVGLEVSTTTGKVLGKVTNILNCGNDVYVVKGEGREVLIPATTDVVKQIDLKKGTMVIEPIEGLLE